MKESNGFDIGRRFRKLEKSLRENQFRFYSIFYKFNPSSFCRWRLARTVKIAAQVPVYRDILSNKSTGFSSFPVIDKQFFKKYPRENWVVPDTKISRMQRHSTSGSTGEPFLFFLDRKFVSVQRFWPDDGLQWLNLKPYKQVILARLAAESNDYEFWDEKTLSIPVLNFLSEPLKYLTVISNFGAESIYSFPSIFLEIVRNIQQNSGFENLKFKYIGSAGEMLYDDDRSLIENVFNGKVFNYYGSEEFGTIGVECNQHQGFHLKGESFFLEIVDDNDVAVKPGDVGRVILTYFDNEVMPFVRYDTGDLGYLYVDPCLCHSQRPRFHVEGRKIYTVKIGDKIINYFHIYNIFRPFGDYIDQYQVIYSKDDLKVTIKVVPRSGFQELEKIIVNKFYSLFDRKISIEIFKVGDIPRQGRKYQSFIVR